MKISGQLSAKRDGGGSLRRGSLVVERLVDLVGIEPTTSSMLWSNNDSRRLILKQLATGRLAKNGYIGRHFRLISGQIFNVRNRATWAGVHQLAFSNHGSFLFNLIDWRLQRVESEEFRLRAPGSEPSSALARASHAANDTRYPRDPSP